MTPRVLATGLIFPEGPVATGEGAVAVVEMQGGSVARVAADGTVTRVEGLGGGPNGAARGASGALYVANNGGLSARTDGKGYWWAPEPFDGRVQRVDPDGTVTTVADNLPGPAPHRPNDLCFGPDGRLYVTDSGNWEDMRNLRPGSVLAIGPGGAVEQVAEVPSLPNGIAFGPGGDTLYVAQTLTRKILAYPFSDGSLGEPRTFCTLPGGAPDGFCFDTEGNLYVCGSLGHAIYVFGPDGTLKQTIETGAGTQPTNCCLVDGQLVVTLSMVGQLVAYEVGAEALALYEGDVR